MYILCECSGTYPSMTLEYTSYTLGNRLSQYSVFSMQYSEVSEWSADLVEISRSLGVDDALRQVPDGRKKVRVELPRFWI